MILPSPVTKTPEEEAEEPRSSLPEEARVRLTPTLIVLGILALVLGTALGIVMSAATFLK